MLANGFNELDINTVVARVFLFFIWKAAFRTSLITGDLAVWQPEFEVPPFHVLIEDTKKTSLRMAIDQQVVDLALIFCIRCNPNPSSSCFLRIQILSEIVSMSPALLPF